MLYTLYKPCSSSLDIFERYTPGIHAKRYIAFVRCPVVGPSVRLSVRELTFALKFCVKVLEILYHPNSLLDWVYILHHPTHVFDLHIKVTDLLAIKPC